MTTRVYKDGKIFDKDTGEELSPLKGPVSMPQIMGFKEYACPITGKPISTLEQHNANLKKHNCVEALEVNPKGATGGEIRNEKFAKKHGLEVSERYKDQPFTRPERKTNAG